MKIHLNRDWNEAAVISDSGHEYHVTYQGSGDADPEYVALWECDCPAGAHGKMCKHIRAVAGIVNSLADYQDPWEDGSANGHKLTIDGYKSVDRKPTGHAGGF
jgi:hypothetical protein